MTDKVNRQLRAIGVQQDKRDSRARMMAGAAMGLEGATEITGMTREEKRKAFFGGDDD